MKEQNLKRASLRHMFFQLSAMLAVLVGSVADHFFIFRQNFKFSFVFVGAAISLVGVLWLAVCLRQLGPSLTPEPIPKEDGALVTTGLYGFCRHPIYLAVLVAGIGWAIIFSSWIGIVLIGPLFFVLNRKAAFEEHLLVGKFGADYSRYMKNVGRFLPFL